jgi:hypothetical protein
MGNVKSPVREKEGISKIYCLLWHRQMDDDQPVDEQDVQKDRNVAREFQEAINDTVYQPVRGEPKDSHYETHYCRENNATRCNQQGVENSYDGSS